MKTRLFTIIITVIFLLAVSTVGVAQQQQQLQQQEQLQSEDISKQELEAFSDAFNEIQSMQQALNNKVNNLIKESELSREKFNQLYTAYTNGNQEKLSQLSESEQENFQSLVNQINNVQENQQEKMVVAVENNDLTVGEFNQIVAAIQQDEELQKRFQSIRQN